jgi:hypothetical protein
MDCNVRAFYQVLIFSLLCISQDLVSIDLCYVSLYELLYAIIITCGEICIGDRAFYQVLTPEMQLCATTSCSHWEAVFAKPPFDAPIVVTSSHASSSDRSSVPIELFFIGVGQLPIILVFSLLPPRYTRPHKNRLERMREGGRLHSNTCWVARGSFARVDAGIVGGSTFPVCEMRRGLSWRQPSFRYKI